MAKRIEIDATPVTIVSGVISAPAVDNAGDNVKYVLLRDKAATGAGKYYTKDVNGDIEPVCCGDTPTAAYKKFVAMVTQVGAADPTFVVMENTLSGIPTFTRFAQGRYTITLPGEFTVGKTGFFIEPLHQPVDLAPFAVSGTKDINSISFGTFFPNQAGGIYNDSALLSSMIEIRVYN